MADLCKGCVLEGRCNDCEDVNPDYYSQQAENDFWDEMEMFAEDYPQEVE